MNQEKDSIWSGVYQSFDDIKLDNAVFNDEIWVNRQKQKIEKLLALYQNGNVLSPAVAMKDYPLSSIIATTLIYKDRLNVIDYGGSMGQTYLDLLLKIPNAEERLDFTIIETPNICAAGTQILGSFKNLHFASDYKNVNAQTDILHLGSTLQYIDDWKSFLKDLEQYFKPDLFILSDLLVDDIPSFATVQRFHDQKIKARFTNTNEFLKFWEDMPYTLILKSKFDPIGNGTYFPNHDLPETHRLKLPCHMVLKRK